MKFIDIFSGNHGTQGQGQPTTNGAGDGDKSNQITNWLGILTGAYNAVTGAGSSVGPAPAPAAPKPTGPNYALYAGIGASVLLLAWLLFKRK